MPTYEYQCKACGHRFDLFQKISDPAPTTCPECEKGPVQKVFTSVGIIFKGSGFYVNDYRKPESKTEGAETKSEPDTKPGAEAKPGTDSKPEAKPVTETKTVSESKPAAEKKSGSAPASEPTKSAA